MNRHKKFVEELFAYADVTVNGSRPWDIQIHNEDFYARIISGGSLALGESYMDGWWDSNDIPELINRIVRANLQGKMSFGPKTLWRFITAKFTTSGSLKRAYEIGERHYDTGNDLFEKMLDKRLVYTCAYWNGTQSLDEAQENKLDLICKKIGLKKGDRVLDIGCGWGSFAKFAAEKYGAQVVGITVSKGQLELARENCKGLPVEIRLQDYRDVNEKFDHIISIGMFEHVGYKHYRTYMEVAERCLKDDGLFLLHTIGANTSESINNPWLDKYIFPGYHLPSVAQISAAAENLFVMEDWHNLSTNYEKTLIAWFENFDRSWDELKGKYSERFYRMWKFYLLVCAGGFRARENQLWQIVFSKKGVKGGYISVR